MSHSWCALAPNDATTNPNPKRHAAANIARRGPRSSTHFPKMAADTPRTTIAMLKIQPTLATLQSPAVGAVTPTNCVSGFVNTLNP